MVSFGEKKRDVKDRTLGIGELGDNGRSRSCSIVKKKFRAKGFGQTNNKNDEGGEGKRGVMKAGG